MTENQHDRFKRVLGEIAAGAENPAALATEALRSRKPSPQEGPSQWQVEIAERKARVAKEKKQRLSVANDFYHDWMSAGYPPIARFAKQHGMTRSSMYRTLYYADRRIPRDQRRLDWYYRSRDYRTYADVIRQRDIQIALWKRVGVPEGGLSMETDEYQATCAAIDAVVEKTRAKDLDDEAWIAAAVRAFKDIKPCPFSAPTPVQPALISSK